MKLLWIGLRAGILLGALFLDLAEANPRQQADAVPKQQAEAIPQQEDETDDQKVNERSRAYRVGPGDVLDVSVYGEPDLTRLVTVQHGGDISFPLLDEVQVAGLTVQETQRLLEELLGRDFLVNPQVSVKVKEYQSQWVTLVGEAARPGKYYLDGPTTLLEILTEAGGFTNQASGEVIVSRLNGIFDDGEVTRNVTLSQDMSPTQQKSALSLVLKSGDLITVSGQSSIYVSGEVRNPGSYPLTAGLTVLKAVSLSGGLGKFGSKGKVEILRKNGVGKPERIKVDLGDIEKGKKPDILLAPGDIVKVGKRIF
jgi:polysaccharide export outer membrane protein